MYGTVKLSGSIEIWYQSSFNIAAALICFSALFYTILQQRIRRPQNRHYCVIVADIALNAVCAALGLYAESVAAVSMPWRICLYVVEYLYFLAHTALGFVLFNYALHLCDAAGDISFRKRIWLSIPAILTEALVVVNPFFHLIYRFDGSFIFHRGDLEFLLYLMAGFYASLSAWLLIKYWKTLGMHHRVAILCFYGLTLSGMLIQMKARTVRVELFFESLAVLGLLFTLEDDDYLREVATGVYNRNAFVIDVMRYFTRNRGFRVFCVRLKDAAALQRVLGMNAGEVVPALVAEYLRQIHPVYYIYRITSTSFMMVFPDGDRHCDPDSIRLAEERFKKCFIVNGLETDFTTYLLDVRVPEELGSLTDLLLMAEIPIPSGMPSRVLKGEDLRFLFRGVRVENALRQAMQENSFIVEYRPIYKTQDQVLWAEEARICVDDGEGGLFSSEELLPVAEQLGMTAHIGDLLLREAFRHIGNSEGVPRYLHVDLYPALWEKEDPAGQLGLYLQEFSVDPERVCLEIPESAVRGDLETLRGVLAGLRSLGFRLVLDHYGAGYADLQAAFSMDFDQVKLDRCLMENALTSDIGAEVLEDNVDMIREMGFSVAADGADDPGHIDFARRFCIDFVQICAEERAVS